MTTGAMFTLNLTHLESKDFEGLTISEKSFTLMAENTTARKTENTS